MTEPKHSFDRSVALGWTACLAIALVSPLAHAAGTHRFSDPFAAYDAGDFDEALRLFLDAQVERPRDPRVAFDLGSTYYRKGDYDAAAQAYSRALDAKDPALRARATYNLGNALFRQQKLEDAVKAYEKAVDLAPRDDDARYNLEVARRLLAERQQQQQQQNEQKPGGNEQKSPEQKPQNGKDQQQKGGNDDRKERGQSGGTQPEQRAGKDDPKHAGGGQQQDRQQPAQQAGSPSGPEKSGQRGRDASAGPAGNAGAERPHQGLSREEAERYLRQLGDTRPRPPHNQRGGRSSPPEKDW